MIDERYSVVFDYLTKGGKPAILQSPPVIMQAAGGGAAAGGVAQGVASALLVGILSAVTGGMIKGFARAKDVVKIPKSATPHPMTMKRYPFDVKKETPKITIPVQRRAAPPQQRVPETARQQADATNDAFNKGQSDSVASLLKRNEEARKRLVTQRDLREKLHKEAERKIVMSPAGQRKLEQQQAHVSQLTMKQVTEASSKIDYKMPDLSPPVIKMPEQMLQAASAKKYEPVPLAPGVSNDIRPLQKQQGLNEVSP